MRKIKVSPTNTASNNNIKNAEDALRQKYVQYNNVQNQNKLLKGTTSSGNSVQSELESFTKQISLSPKKPQDGQNGNHLIVPIDGKLEKQPLPTPQPPSQEQKKFFQKKGKNDIKGKRGSFRISLQNQNDDDVQLNVKFQEEQRKLVSILVKEGAAYTQDTNEANIRLDKFGNQIDHQKKKHKISFNEDITVYEIENWKKYNNSMYDENDDKCHCNLIQMLFFFHLLSM